MPVGLAVAATGGFILCVGFGCACICVFKKGPIYQKRNICLTGKTVLITGGSSGLGRATAIELAKHHGRVVIASRNEAKALRAVEEIKAESENYNIHFMQLDLSDLNDVRRFVTQFVSQERRLDILINNAACMSLEKTQNGRHSIMFATNVLGPFLLTNLLLSLLEKTASTENPKRIVNISDFCYTCGKIDLENLDPVFDENNPKSSIKRNYSTTKLMMSYLTSELSECLRGGVTVYAVDPGTVASDLDLILSWPGSLGLALRKSRIAMMSRSPHLCAQTVVYCCLDPKIKILSGCLFKEMACFPLHPKATVPDVGRNLWTQLEIATQ